ncbi:MAG: hypothetical protein Q7V62_07855, partial [Actinomycetota bacterium]|nr:hypothetical protein [Actinomycetota bacterium]
MRAGFVGGCTECTVLTQQICTCGYLVNGTNGATGPAGRDGTNGTTASYLAFTAEPLVYGTASQSGTTLTIQTRNIAAWTTRHRGGLFVFANGATAAVMSTPADGVYNVLPSQTVPSGTNFTFTWGGVQASAIGMLHAKRLVLHDSGAGSGAVSVDTTLLRSNEDMPWRIVPSTPAYSILDAVGHTSVQTLSMKTHATLVADGASTLSTGTASQSGTTITFSSAVASAAHVGAVIHFTSTGLSAYVRAYITSTTLQADVSQASASGTYTMYFGGTQVRGAYASLGITALSDLTLRDSTNAARTVRIDTTLAASAASVLRVPANAATISDLVTDTATQTLSGKTLASVAHTGTTTFAGAIDLSAVTGAVVVPTLEAFNARLTGEVLGAATYTSVTLAAPTVTGVMQVQRVHFTGAAPAFDAPVLVGPPYPAFLRGTDSAGCAQVQTPASPPAAPSVAFTITFAQAF